MFIRIVFGLLISGAVLAQDKPPPNTTPGGGRDPCKDETLQQTLDDKECEVKSFIELLAGMFSSDRLDVATHSSVQKAPMTTISTR